VPSLLSTGLDTSPMLVLRRRTSVAHEALERRLDLLAPTLDRARYGGLLQRFALAQPGLEAAVADAVGPDIARGRCAKADAIRADLADLGVAAPTPLVPDVAIDSVAAGIGALYVTEGATLGGAVIAGHVAATLGAATPRRFFTSYGADVPARWAELRATVRDVLVTPADVDRAAAAAVDVFGWFHAVLVP
jgi:heme oxygenase